MTEMWMTGRRALNRVIDQASLVLFHCRSHRNSQMLEKIFTLKNLTHIKCTLDVFPKTS